MANGMVAASKCRSCSSSTRLDAMKTANSRTPSRSKRKGAPEPGRFGRRTARTIASRPIGRFTRKTDCQPKSSVRKPPAHGPHVLEETDREHAVEGKTVTVRVDTGGPGTNKK